MKQLIILLAISWCSLAHAQTLVSHREQIEATQTKMEEPVMALVRCMATGEMDKCTTNFIKAADDKYKQYFTANVLYSIDSAKSFQLHKQLYTSNPNELEFILEYAIELHRKGQYEKAVTLYEQYMTERPDDYRLLVWLADCYINTGKFEKAVTDWQKADHAHNHTGIDQAIYVIYGSTTQLKQRNDYRKKIIAGDKSTFYPLLVLDMNWEIDWWNKEVRDSLLEADLTLIKQKLQLTTADQNLIKAYVAVKRFSANEGMGDSIKAILKHNNIIIGKGQLPADGQIASDLLRIALLNHLVDEKEIYNQRGEEILKLVKTTKDKELLNMFAYLQAGAKGKVDATIDKMGWKEYKDERFAISYFIGKMSGGKYQNIDDKELAAAIADFPNSPKLYSIKIGKTAQDGKPSKADIVEIIKREFKTLGSDNDHYSYALNAYFGFLGEKN